LNIIGPTPQIKKVYHPIVQEIEVENKNFKQIPFTEVKGKIRVISEFPLELKFYAIE